MSGSASNLVAVDLSRCQRARITVVDYQYSTSDCDVSDKDLLDTFRSKRAKWIDWLDRDEHHAIWDVIMQMVWNDVSFKTIVYIADADRESAINNPLIVEALLDGHVATQVLAIRRLTDTSKSAISLSKLLQDIRGQRKILTRENYVSFDGLPYDYRMVEEAHYRTVRPRVEWLDTTGPKAFTSSERAHVKFDRLSGVRPDQRKRDDRLPVRLIDTVEDWISTCGARDVAEWSHNYLAHAGSIASRKSIATYELNRTKIGIAIRGLARAAEAVSSCLLYTTGRMNALMAKPQFNPFDRLENAALSATQKEESRLFWESLTREYDGSLAEVESDLILTGRP